MVENMTMENVSLPFEMALGDRCRGEMARIKFI